LIAVYEQLDEGLAQHATAGINVQGKFAGFGEVRVNYSVEGTVKSGHPDTSCGSGALNREISTQAILNLPMHLKPVRVRALIMGDDYLAWLYFEHPVDAVAVKAALDQEEAKLGIHPERGLFVDIRNASFISLGFYVCVDGTIAALPKVGRLLSRLFWSVTDPCGRPMERLAAGIAEAFYPLYCTYPLMRSFLGHHMKAAPMRGLAEHIYRWNIVGTNRLRSPINWTENHLVKYGDWAVALPVELELDGYFGLCHHPAVSQIYTIDTADPADRLGCVA
jgi:hypothetical protein